MLKEVTFVRFFLTSLEIKLAKELKNKGFKIYCITFYRIDKGYDGIFDKEYYIRNERYENLSGVGGAVIKKNLKSFNFYKALPGFYRRIRKMNDSIVIGVGEPNFFVTMIFKILRKKAVLKLFFPYDVTYLRYTDYKKNAWYDRRPEKKLFNMADGIIHKGRIDELELLPMEFNATNKPSIQFLAYCDEDDMLQIKNTKKQGEIHLVYAGVAIHKRLGYRNVIKNYKDIVEQKIYLDIYPLNYSQLIVDEEYKELLKNKYFTMHKPVFGSNFQKELNKYDWGVHITHFNNDGIGNDWFKTTSTNKISSYLEAGLPIIINDKLKFSSEIVRTNSFGIVISNAKEIRDRIKDVDYGKMVNAAMKNRQNFTVKNNINRMIEFMGECNIRKEEGV